MFFQFTPFTVLAVLDGKKRKCEFRKKKQTKKPPQIKSKNIIRHATAKLVQFSILRSVEKTV